MRKKQKNERGFTLVELMVVIAIIGVLVAIALPKFMNQANKAKIASAQATLASMKTSIEVYYADTKNNKYPANATEVTSVLEDDGFASNTVDPWGNKFKYWVDTNRKSYYLWSVGPDDTTNTNDDVYVTESLPPTIGAVDKTGTDIF